MSERFKRQSGIVSSKELKFPIHVLGAGGIGSWTVLILAKMGCSNIICYDNDKVEDHNVASQFYKESQLGEEKVEALKENVLEQTGIEISAAPIIDQENIKEGLIIIAIDSMEGRISLGEMYKEKDVYIIDARMGGLQLEIYTRKASEYLATTVPPGDVDPEACTEKAISFNVAVIGGLIGNLVRLYAKKELKDIDMNYIFNTNTLLKEYKKDVPEAVVEDTVEEIKEEPTKQIVERSIISEEQSK